MVRFDPWEESFAYAHFFNTIAFREALSLGAQLARRFGIEPQSMTGIVKSLEGRRLISRREADSNRRVLRIRLTSAGRHCLEACDRTVDQAEGGVFAKLSQTELATLRLLLQKILGQDARNKPDRWNDQPTRKKTAKI